MHLYFKTITLVLFLSSCGSPIKSVVIDNPSKDPLTLTFNDAQTVKLAPWEEKTVDITYGNTSIAIDGESPVQVELDPDQAYMINPRMATYYIQDIAYIFSNQGSENYQRRYGNPTSEVEGLMVNGIFEKRDGLIIPKTWTYGVNDDAANRGSKRSVNSSGYVIVKKIHRLNDLTSAITSSALETLAK